MPHDEWVVAKSNEVSAGGVAGPATPLGKNAFGNVPTSKQQKERIKAANIWK